MLLVVGVWTFLRAVLVGSAATALENLRAPPSTPGPPALRSPTPPGAAGPAPLGLAVPGLGGLAIQSRHRAAGDGARVASPRLAALLALEVQAEPARPP